jgi:hypothetical protein
MGAHIPVKYRHCIAMFADDTAAGADTLEELLEIYKALVVALDKAGIQVKASKVEFGVEEITFHNYRIIGGDGPMANTTTPKDETLDLNRHCTIPQTVTQLKALFLGINPANGLLCTVLRTSCGSAPQTHPQRGDFPQRIKMDSGI